MTTLKGDRQPNSVDSAPIVGIAMQWRCTARPWKLFIIIIIGVQLVVILSCRAGLTLNCLSTGATNKVRIIQQCHSSGYDA